MSYLDRLSECDEKCWNAEVLGRLVVAKGVAVVFAGASIGGGGVFAGLACRRIGHRREAKEGPEGPPGEVLSTYRHGCALLFA